MLQTLHIENIAVIRRTDVDLSEGFSVLSGETGAGKSIIIDSIGFVLGARGGRELIRTGAERAVVSALFSVSEPMAERLLALGAECEGGELLIERTLTAEGRTTARLNGRPVTLALLRSVAEHLVNIHGQSDTHTLTNSENQRRILDDYAESAQELSRYTAAYEELSRLRAEIRKISADEAGRLREVEMLRYQIADIETHSLREGEEEKLSEKKKRLKSIERITKQTSFAYRALRAGEKANVLYILERTISALDTLADVIPAVKDITAELEDCRSRIEDAAESVRALSEEDEGDATKLLNAVENRLATIERLGRKYGGSVETVLAYCAEAKARLSLLENADARLDELKAAEAAALTEATVLAHALHEKRAAAAAVLSERVQEVLAFLDMPKVRFSVSVRERQGGEGLLLTRDGGDDVEFLLAANPGEPLMPLSSIASGGELARIMLAIKSVISDRDGIGTVIYDEIDAGVSGKTARKLGIELLRSSGRGQVLCVTHSAQIASLADTHYLIKKTERDGRAETEVVALDEEGRITELSRILGGIEVTETQRRAALELYTERSAYKEA
ncbi:MAG: DNA repair protein RecN [Clostridia bacterium]|nr:DNA repair protein RecN [Clostridia bacterium]